MLGLPFGSGPCALASCNNARGSLAPPPHILCIYNVPSNLRTLGPPPVLDAHAPISEQSGRRFPVTIIDGI